MGRLHIFQQKGVGFFVDPAGSSILGSAVNLGIELGTGTIVIIYIASLILSAYFAASETAFTAVSKVRLRTLADKGKKSAKTALWVCDRFDKTLTTILIGNNVFHMLGATVTAMFYADSSRFIKTDIVEYYIDKDERILGCKRIHTGDYDPFEVYNTFKQ